jgi:hypothetical protein
MNPKVCLLMALESGAQADLVVAHLRAQTVYLALQADDFALKRVDSLFDGVEAGRRIHC